MEKNKFLIGVLFFSIILNVLGPIGIVQSETIESENNGEKLSESSSAQILESSSIALPSLPIVKNIRNYEPIYSNKEAQYEINQKGTYPAFAWQPASQTNVINHQGGVEGQRDWDNVTSWDVSEDKHDQSYIKYGDDAMNPNIQLRKYAQQTDEPDEFKIKLNVKGNTIYKPGVDIVFLLDNSDSMSNADYGDKNNRKDYAIEAMEKIVAELKKVYVPSVENIRIGGHIFSDYTRNGWGYDPGEISSFKLSQNPADWDKLVSEYKRADALGGTFTQRGLTEANDIFEEASDSSGRQKMLLVLTDGAPNLSWVTNDTGTPDREMFVDRLHFTNFDSGTKGKYKDGDTLKTTGYKTTIIPPYNGVINSHITTTNSIAMDMKKAGIEIHTIVAQLTVNVNERNKREELLRGLYKMSTKKANGNQDPDKDTAEDFFFYNVEKCSDLTAYFKNWYQTIIRTVEKGIITDPLGDMVELVTDSGKEPKVNQVVNGSAKIEEKPTISYNADQIIVDTINLTDDQEIEVEYTVRLKINNPAFISNHWYSANKLTTLQPLPERTKDLLTFGNPSVKMQKADFIIPVKKVWSDDYLGQADYWALRPPAVTVTLQQLKDLKWTDVESKILNAENDWQETFSPVFGGDENNYRVIESTRVTGYKEPSVNQTSFTSKTLMNEGIKITNELLRGNYQFWKFMEDGQTPFSNEIPKFQVRRVDGKILAENLIPDSAGKIVINELPIGEYLIEESEVPQGFQKMVDIELQVTENNPPTSLLFKVNGSEEEYQAINSLKDFSLKVEKVDQDGEKLAGARFKLTGKNYEVIKDNGPTFIFPALRPGNYLLNETENPDGYQRIKEAIKFRIAIDGKVTISPHSSVNGISEITKELEWFIQNCDFEDSLI